jgi:two-component system, response regulator
VFIERHTLIFQPNRHYFCSFIVIFTLCHFGAKYLYTIIDRYWRGNKYHEVEWKMKKIEILLVEDNPDDAELVMMALEQNKNIAECKIHFAKDGIEALQYLFDPEDEDPTLINRPHLILLDLKLPRINGLEVLRRIKSHPEAKKIPIVILTSSNEEKDIVESYHFGANSYIRKPVDFNQFTEAVNQIGLYGLVLNMQSP